MADEVRYDWHHGIAPRKRDAWHRLPVDRIRRLSGTFRFAVAGSPVPAESGRNGRDSHKL
jgi:hypothetical protein